MMFREGKSSTDHSVIFCAIAWLQVLLILHQASSQPTGQTQEDAYGSDSNFDPSMPIIVVVLVGIFFFIGFLFIYIRHCTTHPEGRSLLQTAVTDRSRQHGLDPAVLETFPIFAYSSVKDVKLGEGVLECAVCLSQFEDDETLRLITKCNHVFHLDCIDAWLAFQSTCPVCRAKLSSESSELDKVGNTPQQRAEPNTEIINDGGNAEAEVVNQVVINVNDDQNRELQEIETTLKQNPPPRSRISGKFPRSHSTGHSLAQPGESTERYTLRLPEEVRKRIEADFKLKRTITDGAAFASEEIMNSMKGRSTEDGSGRGKTLTERWIFSVTPPFVSRSGTVKSPKAGGEGETGNVVTLLTSSVKVPLKCLSLKVDRAEGSSRWPSV